VALVPNRYAFLLFRHTTKASLVLAGKPTDGYASGRQRAPFLAAFSLTRLLRENAGLEAARRNFVHVRGHGKPKPPPARRGG